MPLPMRDDESPAVVEYVTTIKQLVFVDWVGKSKR